MKAFLKAAVVVVLLLALTTACLFWEPAPKMKTYSSATAGAPSPDSGWPQYGNTAGGLRYSALDQINRSNVERLKLAWSYQAGELAKIKSGAEPFNPWE